MGILRTTLSLLALRAIPIRKNRVLFTSFGGHYSDNPKYISQAMHRLDPSKEQIWLVKKQYLPLLPDYVTGVDIDSPEARMARGSAAAIVDNVYGEKGDFLDGTSFKKRLRFKIVGLLKNKKGQHVYSTMHGTPLKRMAADQVGSTVIDFSCPRTTMLLGNQFTLDVLRRLTYDRIKFELIGSPRNDLLFKKGQQQAMKKKLGLPADKKVLLFAPTFRNDGNRIQDTNLRRSGLDQLDAMDFDRLFQTLSQKFGGDWVLVCRFHYHVEQQVDWTKMEEAYPGRIINGNFHDDMAEYLAAADLLLTDASSSMFDFALTGRPCLLFFPDMDYYCNTERGFYIPLEELPFPASADFEGLLSNICAFDPEPYNAKVEELLKSLTVVDDEHSSERVANYILARI